LILVWVYRLFPSLLDTIIIVKPESVNTISAAPIIGGLHHRYARV